MADNNSEKKTPTLLDLPKLPTSIKGDGRYLMSLLRDFLTQATEQINLANGFDAEEISPDAEGAVQTPRNFRLTFSRAGGLFSWDHISDFRTLAYYEVRTDTLVGTPSGLLERTVNNSSSQMSVNAVDHIYLYAFNKDGEYSMPAELYYNKPRPDAPTNISIIKNQEGSLISFSAIPSDCIGANIYIDGAKYTTFDSIFLSTEEVASISQIAVAFFDPFGEGETGFLYLVLPDVTGFLVERNGPELDFYWNPINIYNIKYVVKVCQELSWEKGTELFRTTTNDKNRHLYPNRGTYYLMVKAYNEQGVYSQNAAYQILDTQTDISRNVILEYPQIDTLYGGVKINMYYNPIIQGVQLNRDASKGEYICDIQLPQKYRARNWLEYNAFSIEDDNHVAWEDAHVTWEEYHRQWAGVLGNIDSAKIKQEIAYYLGDDDIYRLFNAMLNGELSTTDKEEPVESKHADDFQNGRWALGLRITDLTRLSYDLTDIPDHFNITFWLKMDKPLEDTLLMTMFADSNDYLAFGYDRRLQQFFINASDGKNIVIPNKVNQAIEYYFFGLEQTRETRTLYLYRYSDEKIFLQSVEAKPITHFNKLYCYPTLIAS